MTTRRAPALNIDKFPPPLRRQLKARAALDGTTVRESVIEAVQMWVLAKMTTDQDQMGQIDGTSTRRRPRPNHRVH